MGGFLVDHGVATLVTTIPTGIDIAGFEGGDGNRARAALGIPRDAFVVGHVGRLAPEKNLDYLTQAIRSFLIAEEKAHFLVIGDGPMREAMRRVFIAHGLAGRVHLPGASASDRLADMYAAMDVFAFSSHSETQGLVLAEAMAAGVPVVALDAFGAREMVRNGLNGRLLPTDAPPDGFAEAVRWAHDLGGAESRALRRAACRTAKLFTRERATSRMLELYRSLAPVRRKATVAEDSSWQTAKRRIEREWKILSNVAHAIGEAVMAEPALASAMGKRRTRAGPP